MLTDQSVMVDGINSVYMKSEKKSQVEEVAFRLNVDRSKHNCKERLFAVIFVYCGVVFNQF